ncbi:MAG: NAD(P)/FAD-dependent oxidoreductase, partial [Clostridia bacterium]|nr:NAD(P)/FAD-dependent oxidoreductase [Clostridia bacterium]
MKTIVVGGGAAGAFAAHFSAQSGDSVTVIEKNEKIGKKLYITGKGRCNLTNNVPISEFLTNVVHNPKFLYGALSELSPSDVIEFFEKNG